MADPATSFQRAFRLHREGHLAEALADYDKLLTQWPTHAEGLHYSGVALVQLGRADAAVARIEQSLRIDAHSPDAWCNLALAYQAQGRHDVAIAALQEALRRDSRQAEIWNNLAGALLTVGRAAEAEQAARQATSLAANHAPSWFNLALCLQAQARIDEALRAATRALQAAPGEIAPSGLKAQLEEALGKLTEARVTLIDALARNPEEASLHFQRAGIEERLGDLPAAAQCCDRALRLAPRHGPALSDLLFLRKRQADWHDLGSLRARFREGVAAGQPHLSPFCLLSDPSSRARQRRCAERWSALFPAAAISEARRVLSADRLRIGYLSSDFHQHATAVLSAGLFEHHDRGRFEIFGYSTGPDDASPMRARLAAAFDCFVDARDWAVDRLASRICADHVDLLVDLKGHTLGAPTAVMARRPAPIQINYLGYPGTMGAPYVDYLIGDALVTPFEHAADYAETLVQLPASYQVNDRQRPIAAAPPRQDLGLPDDAVVFCCFNSSYKINPEVFSAWLSILAQVPRSVLWLLGRGTDVERDPTVMNLRREAATRGADPARLVFARTQPNAEYLALFRRADLFLDTWPYNAHTTASDALWAGCPVLTWLGETFASRVAASLLTAVGLPELIAANVADYVGRAIALAHDAAARDRYRAHLAGHGRASALFDTQATTRGLEAAYLRMADDYRRGVRAPFRVEPPAP